MYFFTRISPKGSKGKRFKRTIQCDQNQGKDGIRSQSSSHLTDAGRGWKKSGKLEKISSKNGELIGTKTSLVFCKEDEEFSKQRWQMKEYMLETKLYEKLGGKMSKPILVLCVVYLNKEHKQNPNPSSMKRPRPADPEFNSSPNSKEPRGAIVPDMQITNNGPDYNFHNQASSDYSCPHFDSLEYLLDIDEQTEMLHQQPQLFPDGTVLQDPMFLNESGATYPNAHIQNLSSCLENLENDFQADWIASETSELGEYFGTH